MPLVSCLSFFRRAEELLTVTQENILKKLAFYVRQNRGPRLLVEALDEGNCYGLSICMGAMNLLGKRDWWVAILRAVNDWDKQASSLNKIIVLPNSTRSITLREIFEKAIHFIVFHQASYKHSLDVNQTSLVDPRKKLIEIVQSDGTVATLQHTQSAAGNFSCKQLRNLINACDINQAICLVENDTHTLHLRYDNNSWFLYDSNNDHSITNAETIHTNKTSLAKSIIDILGKNIGIKILYFEKNPRAAYSLERKFKAIVASKYVEKLLGRDSDQVDSGFHTIVQNAPEHISSALNLLYRRSRNQKKVIEVLMAKNTLGQSSLLQIINSAPEYLLTALNFLPDSEEKTAEVSYLLESTIAQISGLESLLKKVPQHLYAILTLCGQDPNPDLISLAKTLLNKSDPDLLTGQIILSTWLDQHTLSLTRCFR